MISFRHDAVELSLRLGFSSIYFIYILIGNYLAQEIIDYNNNVFIIV